MDGPAGYDCLLLAAGGSTRMGAWKPLLPWRGATVIEWSVRHALEFCRRVLLVSGYRGAELRALFAGRPGVETVENPGWRRGMLSSIQAGAARVESGRFFIALGDMPLVGGGIYRLLAMRLEAAAPATGGPEGGGRQAARPVCGGRTGHPVLLDRSLVPRILAADPALSMRDLLREVEVLEVPAADGSVLIDLDTPADYEAGSPG